MQIQQRPEPSGASHQKTQKLCGLGPSLVASQYPDQIKLH
ncbi:hypothetical protein P20311_3105 [Pseudoalteromonas sp. BSi20311]|nr:hypothetical protein P20311_3105 [Pseudoalteromonas sp. BSi20311]GAA72385.1 hypothetical protein P20439_2473 [Pseudoalteromonas sp. BSi20439]